VLHPGNSKWVVDGHVGYDEVARAVSSLQFGLVTTTFHLPMATPASGTVQSIVWSGDDLAGGLDVGEAARRRITWEAAPKPCRSR